MTRTTEKKQTLNDTDRRPRVVDLFCGAGGLTQGFVREGFDVRAGIDVDPICQYPYEFNNKTRFLARDVSTLAGAELRGLAGESGPFVLVGCAPCQPFSSYNQKNKDPKWKLLADFARLIEESKPDVVSMENVPQLTRFRGGRVFRAFVRRLRAAGYEVSWRIVFAPEFGVPQRRKRLVLLASRHGPISLIEPSIRKPRFRTVRSAIEGLPRLKAGHVDAKDSLHRASRLSPTNARRIARSRPGGTWKDWEKDLVADCHVSETGRGYGAVYGRMRWDEPAPTITTQFFGFGNGRFGHPEQDRGLSLREGALLQTFPRRYRFTAPGKPVHITRIGELIGNAVPVLLGRAIAKSVKLHLDRHL